MKKIIYGLIFLFTTSSLLANKSIQIGAGGLVTINRDLRQTSTEFTLKDSLFLYGEVITNRAGYFMHFLYLKNTNPPQEKTYASTGYLWFKPHPKVEIKIGKLKKPTDKTYLSSYFTWIFPTHTRIFSVLKEYEMVPSFPGIQLSIKPFSWLKIQSNLFQDDKLSENFQYFAGIDIKRGIKQLRGEFFYFHAFQPAYAEVEVDQKKEKIKRNSNTAGLKLNLNNFTLLYQFADLIITDSNYDTYISSNLIDTSYKIPIFGIFLRPRFRFEYLKNKKNIDRYYTTGIDFIIYERHSPFSTVKVSLEYTGSNNGKEDQVKTVFTVVYF